VVHGGEGALGKAHRKTQVPQHLERLGTGDLMDEMQPDKELGLSTGEFAHAVRVPNLVEEVAAGHMLRRGSMRGGAYAKVPDAAGDSGAELIV